MAIIGTFEADFSQFSAAVRGAETNLKSLEASSRQVVTGVESIGGTLRNIAGAFGVAFSAAAVIQFGKSVIDTASDIHDMSLKLGISAEAVQGFKFAAEQAGSSLDTVGTAINKMNINLTEGGKGTIAALKSAGLEFTTIRALKPEDAFLAITDAVAQIEDPMQRAQVMTALFGRSAAELLPAVQGGFRGVADSAEKMSKETIESLERAQDAWSKFGNSITIVTGSVLAKGFEFLEWYGRVADAWSTGIPMANAAAEAAEKLPEVLQKTAPELESYSLQLAKTKAEVAALSVEQLNDIKAAKDLGLSVADLSKEFNLSEGAIRVVTEQLKDQETAADKVTAAVKRMTDAQKTYLDVLLPGMSKLAELERSRAIQAGKLPAFTAEGLKPLDFLPGGKNESQPTGAYKQIIDQAAAEREHAEAQAEANRQMEEGLLIIGQYPGAHQEAGDAAAASTNQAVQGYAAVAQSVGLATQQVERFAVSQRTLMELGEASRQFNKGLATGTQESLLRGFEIVTARGGAPGAGVGAGHTINIDAKGSFFDTPDGQRQFFDKVDQAIESKLRSLGRQVV